MKITTKTGLVGFLLALSALNPPDGAAQVNPPKEATALPTIEERLAAIAQALKHRENQLQVEDGEALASSRKRLRLIADATRWLNGAQWRDGRDFANWPNNWRDFSGFVDFRNQ